MTKMECLLRVLPLNYCVLLTCLLLNYCIYSSVYGDDISPCGGDSVVNCIKCENGDGRRCLRCSQLVVFRRCNSTTSITNDSSNTIINYDSKTLGLSVTSGIGAESVSVSSRAVQFDPAQGCPPGYIKHHADLEHYMATVCSGTGSDSWSDEAIGAIVGVCLCLVGLAAGVGYIRRRQSCSNGWTRAPSSRLPGSSSSSASGSAAPTPADTAEYRSQVAALRPHAHTFLDMMNDTRKQCRHLHSPTALQPYKPVLKDLSRILILVNRRESRLGPPPPDWETLLAWAQRVLNRYKKNHQSNQVSDLVSFLGGGDSGPSMSQFAVSVFDSNYNTQRVKSDDDWPQWATELDDFFTLGFRPQDEITTEL